MKKTLNDYNEEIMEAVRLAMSENDPAHFNWEHRYGKRTYLADVTLKILRKVRRMPS